MLQPRSAATSAAVALLTLVPAFALAPAAQGQFIFADNATPAEIAAYTAAYEREYPVDERYVTTTRWPGNVGEPANIFLSYVPDGLLIPSPPGVAGGALPSVLFSGLDARFIQSGGRNQWLSAVGLPDSPGVQTSNLITGGSDYWNEIASSGLQIGFIRRPAATGGNPLDLWDDGAAWSAPGPAHPAPVSTILTVTLNPVQLASATLAVSADSSSFIITLVGGSSTTFNLTQPANDTLGELVTSIGTITGLSATLPSGVAGSTASASLAPGQSLIVNSSNTTANFQSGPAARGDIRISMRSLPASILAFATPPDATGGDIILNSTIDWRQGTGARTLRNSVGRAVGLAIGLDLVCPNNKTKLMEPILNTTFDGLGFDDIRGVHRLYGNGANPFALGFIQGSGFSTEPNDDAAIAPGLPGGPWDLGFFSTLVNTNRTLGVSIDDVTDRDFFAISFAGLPNGDPLPIDYDIKITVIPVGGTYSVAANTTACTGTPINASAIFNLRANFFSLDGTPLGDGSPTSTAPFSVFIDTAGAGFNEIVTSRILSTGTFLIGVDALGNAGTESQLYNLQMEFVNRNLLDGLALGPIVTEALFLPGQTAPEDEPQPRLEGYNGHGALSFGSVPGINTPHFFNTNYFGARATYATVEADDPDPNHIAFGGRPITRVRWTGVNPAVESTDTHPTATTATGAGVTIPRGDSFFRGVAPEVEMISAGVATEIFPDGSFLSSPESVYFSLFAISDPLVAPLIGLARPATVINSSIGALSDQRGDSGFALAYDAAVFTYGVTAVVSAGNSGEIDNTDDCGNAQGLPDDLPGRQFVGSRTVGFPASAFNVLSVGAAGKGFYNEPFPPPPTDGGDGGGGGGGGGGGRPDNGNIRGGANGPDIDPRGLALNTVVNFSSKGPVDTFNYSRTAQAVQIGTRPGVHIIAAGSGIIERAIDPDLYDDSPDPCDQYGDGHNQLGTPETEQFGLGLPAFDPASTARFAPTRGTSFAAPIVAGAVALLQDFGLAQVPPLNINSLVMRAVLMTSAVKLPGWSNNGNPASPQDNRDGRAWEEESELINNQLTGVARPLDLAQGAGLLSIPQAFSIYAAGELRDSPLTDPTRPSQTPAGEIPLPEFPGNPGRPGTAAAVPTTPTQWTRTEIDEMKRLLPEEEHLSPVESERLLRDIRDSSRGMIIKPTRPDFTDPDLTPGGGGKSGAGTFDDREPFIGGGNTPGGFQGDGPAPTRPIEIGTPIFGGSVGWDIANLGIKPLRLASGGRVGGVIDYIIPINQWPAAGGAEAGPRDYLTATLVWNRHVKVRPPNFTNLDNPRVGELIELELEDLNLELYLTIDGNIFDGQEPLAFSRTTFSNIEHLHYQLQTSGVYVLRVTWADRNYNFFRNLPRGGVPFAVAWGWADRMLENVSFPNVIPAPPTPPPALGMPLLSAVLFHFGGRLGEPNYSALADVNQDGIVNTGDLMWVLARLGEAPQPQHTAQE
ncbi:MAG: S8 family serine peptidase [Phycisphaerales bacterium]